MNRRHLIIFDGLCNLCNASVNFIIERDPNAVFQFTPMQGDLAKSLLVKHNIGELADDTFVLIKNGMVYVRTEAALEITKDLIGPWRLFRAFKILPTSSRDFFYRLLAKHRYRLFGKRKSCIIPTKTVKNRFIE